MKKEELVAARLPEELVTELRRIERVEQADRSTVVRKLLCRAIVDWKKEYMAKLYSEGRISLERAAMEAGISVREMMEYFRQRKVSAQYGLEDLEEDMKNFYKRIAK
jgi:predicted HTH domain antitoxin